MLAAGRLRSRDAGRQCRRRGRGRQAGHRHRLAGRAALAHAACGALARRGEDRVRLGACSTTRLGEWRRQGLRIGFTNGCFDLLHPGHVKVLTEARAACDRLIVGLNSDASVRRLKGQDRPVQGEQARAEVLAALEAVDLVVIFEQDTPLELIRRVRPKVLVKGGDYTPRAGGRPRRWSRRTAAR